MEKKVFNLLEYLGLKNAKVKKSQYDDNTYTVGEEKYLILSDEKSTELSKRNVVSLINEIDITSFDNFIQEYIFEHCMDDYLFEETMKEHFKNYINYLKKESSIEKGFKNKLVEEMYNNGCKDEETYLLYLCSGYENGIHWYRENFGDDIFSKAVKKYCSLDVDKISNFWIAQYGRGNSLKKCTGEEILLADNYYAYRLR